MKKLLSESIVKQVNEAFDQLTEPVHIMFFGSEENCDYCNDTRQLVEEVTSLSDKVSLAIYDIIKNSDVAQHYKIDKTPGLVIAAKDSDQVIDFGIRYAGIPSGHEFSSLIQDIILVSGRDSGLNEQTRKILKGLTNPLLLQVFVTPTCPYCPRAVVLAHQMAMENPLIQAEMVEAMEFPELADRYGVSGVPHTTINSGAGHVVGAVTEGNMLAEIMRVAGKG